jgi:hypothetical protein
MKINKQSRDVLLGLFRSFLPLNNNLPQTYSMLVKSLNYKSNYTSKNICSNCNIELNAGEKKCNNGACVNILRNDLSLKLLPTKKVYIFNVEHQIREILDKEC